MAKHEKYDTVGISRVETAHDKTGDDNKGRAKISKAICRVSYMSTPNNDAVIASGSIPHTPPSLRQSVAVGGGYSSRR